LHVLKYRGSIHGTNAYPFLIDDHGISVMPITSVELEYPAVNERVSTGISRLDRILGGLGYYRSSTVLISGTAGTGKTTVAASFTDASCRRKERVLYFAFEESRNQIIRNMASVGLDLASWVRRGLLRFQNTRPTLYGLEIHLAMMLRAIHEFRPRAVILDPISAFDLMGKASDIKSMLMRLLDHLKMDQITTLLTSLTKAGNVLEYTEIGISSLADTWLMLRDVESAGERNRLMYILKSRGMAHSSQVREFLITDRGVELVDVYVGAGQVLTGAARMVQEAQEETEHLARQQEIERLKLDLKRKHRVMEAQVEVLQSQFEAEEAEIRRAIKEYEVQEERMKQSREKIALKRHADDMPAVPGRKRK